MEKVALKCITCGKEEDVIIPELPDSIAEFYELIKKEGWYPVIDVKHGRGIIFCSQECTNKQLTRRGTLRKRLIKCKKE